MIKYFGFSRRYRLATKAEFKQVFDQSRKVSQKYLLILYRPNQKEYARIGIIVGKRFVPDAVDRNRIRRIARESFRLIQARLAGFDIILMVRQSCHELSNANLKKGIDELWEKLLQNY